jgi:hypothetical protein
MTMKIIYILYASIAANQQLAVPVQQYQTSMECISAAVNLSNEQINDIRKVPLRLENNINYTQFTCIPQLESGFGHDSHQ